MSIIQVNFHDIVLKNWKKEIEVEITLPKALNYFKNNHLVPNQLIECKMLYEVS